MRAIIHITVFTLVLQSALTHYPHHLKITHTARMRLSFDGQPIREIAGIGLFGNDQPKIVQNFIDLCEGKHINPETK